LIKNNNNNNQWRTSGASPLDWLPPNYPTPNEVAWLAPPQIGPAPPFNGVQHGAWFCSTFGYSPENVNRTITDPPSGNPPVQVRQPFSPMVIISAGGDKTFYEWGDNLDSYRLQINTSGQQ
jgi:hypothetical protein